MSAPQTSGDRSAQQQLRIRRAPKYSAFLVTFAALGVVVALILTLLFGPDPENNTSSFVFNDGQVFGFMALICGSIGLLLGGAIALLLDWRFRKQSKELAVTHEKILIKEEDPSDSESPELPNSER